MPCRLEDAHDNAKENMDGSAASVRVKTEEDVGLQQPTEGRSGLYKPLFWVDLEMTGVLLSLLTDVRLQPELPRSAHHAWKHSVAGFHESEGLRLPFGWCQLCQGCAVCRVGSIP